MATMVLFGVVLLFAFSRGTATAMDDGFHVRRQLFDPPTSTLTSPGAAGPALREMTRLAASPASLWNRLVGRLRKEVIGELQRAQSYLTELEMAINFEEPLDKWFDRANKLRAELEADEQKRNEG